MLACLERPGHLVIVLSRGERQSKEFIERCVAPHVRAIGCIADGVNAAMPGTDVHTQEVRFGNGSKIIALPANPATARSYEGDVVLDEFGFHQDARKIYEAVAPSITRGFSVRVISTPNGQQGQFYELAKAAGCVPGEPRSSTDWSAHKCDIHEAVAQGCKDKDGNPLNVDAIRRSCIDEEMWLQEYCCQFLSTASQWIPPELYESCVSTEARDGGLLDDEYGTLYLGWDIARKKDFSVVWILKEVGDVFVTRAVIEYRNVPTPVQKRDALAFLQKCNRGAVDCTGMGLAIYEEMREKLGTYKVEGVTFTINSKQEMAVHGKNLMETARVRLPDNDTVRASFRSVKKITTPAGLVRFDAEQDEQAGHADHWWAYCLAVQATGRKLELGLVNLINREVEKRDAQIMAEKIERSPGIAKVEVPPNTERCPLCNWHGIARRGPIKRCSSCGHEWGGPNRGEAVGGRAGLIK